MLMFIAHAQDETHHVFVFYYKRSMNSGSHKMKLTWLVWSAVQDYQVYHNIYVGSSLMKVKIVFALVMNVTPLHSVPQIRHFSSSLTSIVFLRH